MATAKTPSKKAARPAKAPVKKASASMGAVTPRARPRPVGVKSLLGTRPKAPAKKAGVAAKPARSGAAAGNKGRLMAKASDPGTVLKERLEAIVQVGQDVTGDKQSFTQMCGILQDTAAAPALRGQALSILQAATFDPVSFTKYRASYLRVLRSLRTDPDPEIRQRAFGLLAREQDPDTQALLLDGLEHPDKALLPTEKALQLLSYDPHAGAYEVAKKIAQKPPNDLARREALRVLAADSSSVDLFAGVLEDKGESTDVRQIAASALNHLAPHRMQQIARTLAMDDTETDDARAVGLTALAHFGESPALSADASLKDKVERLGASTDNAELLAAAQGFKARYS